MLTAGSGTGLKTSALQRGLSVVGGTADPPGKAAHSGNCKGLRIAGHAGHDNHAPHATKQPRVWRGRIIAAP